MNDFVFYNPTNVYFGKQQLVHLPAELKRFGTRVLMVYGEGSIKRIGLYEQIQALLAEAGLENVTAQSILLAMAYNVTKLHHKIQNGNCGKHLFALNRIRKLQK